MDSINITVVLEGIIDGPVKHVSRQKHTVLLSEEEGGSMTRIIKHTDREELPCVKIIPVSSEVVTKWVGECPPWENPFFWKKMSKVQRVISHVNTFDEGFGVSFEFLGDGE